ncbi:site-specific integrase [Gloeocapsa sp. BRSZ]
MREIKPVNNNGSIQLRFSFSGKRYGFNPVPGGCYSDKRDLATARAIANRIQNDILAGCFDASLDKYRLTPKPSKDKPSWLLELFDLWVDSLDLEPATRADHYEMLRRMLVRANPAVGDIGWLASAKISAATYNKRLSYLKSCFKWAVENQLTDVNPVAKLKPKRVNTAPIKPFSTVEIDAIISGFKVLAPSYLDFVRFLFLTGCRLSEAIGLTWSHIDFELGTVTIAESLSIDRTGNGYQRLRKETKAGTVRQLEMNPTLRSLLLEVRSTNTGELVFRSPDGYVVASGNFRRVWVKVLRKVGVPYRKPHTIRHTVLSMALEQGTAITGVAYLAGHKNTRMVVQTYGHVINRPRLPDIL